MVCGNTEVSRDGLVSQPTAEWPSPSMKGWPQLKSGTMWLTYSNQKANRVDLFVDRRGDLQEDFKGKGTVDRSDLGTLKATQAKFKHSLEANFAAAILAVGKPHTHLVGRIVGSNPRTAILVIDRMAHHRLESGSAAGARAPTRFSADRFKR